MYKMACLVIWSTSGSHIFTFWTYFYILWENYTADSYKNLGSSARYRKLYIAHEIIEIGENDHFAVSDLVTSARTRINRKMYEVAILRYKLS